jgi:hypothetical protein
MASQQKIVVQDLISVNHARNNGVYEVRVLKKWRVPDYSNPGTFSSVDMVLIDKNVGVFC